MSDKYRIDPKHKIDRVYKVEKKETQEPEIKFVRKPRITDQQLAVILKARYPKSDANFKRGLMALSSGWKAYNAVFLKSFRRNFANGSMEQAGLLLVESLQAEGYTAEEAYLGFELYFRAFPNWRDAESMWRLSAVDLTNPQHEAKKRADEFINRVRL
ncbi:hypothetical protein [Paraburkholderia antibiotica]|uniref:Uncharacterized protein n=1 Tax=Paraburkholderia antibiotica TaxID=2728839 RepID=A0A7Y0A129_9BURK|nr:hypothetical protein [Paraburkholderia antibiotica]NML34540.1 hypothetical protein [Paraburkholderia antibiotica]